MNQNNKTVVKVIYDEQEGRPRVTPLDYSGWVRFPKHLRVIGAVYQVELKDGKAGSYIAVGEIEPLNTEARTAVFTSTKMNGVA